MPDLPPLPRSITPRLAFPVAALAIFLVHLPVLDHYFFGDDFVPLADIASRSAPRYIADLLLLQDETPNWRFLTGLYYLASYESFGLNAFPYFLVSVLVHIGTAGLIFAFLWRTLQAAWPAAFGATVFGLTPASVPTVGQITAFNNVLAAFLLMLCLVLLQHGLRRERVLPWSIAAAAAFAAAIAANESLAVLAPLPPLLVLWHVSGVDGWWRYGATLKALALHAAPYAVIGGAALVSLAACDCTSVASGGTYGFGGHVDGNLLLYLGRLLYPVGMEPPGDPNAAHAVAGLALAVVALAALARGPNVARFAAMFLLLALAPYVPLKLWSAPRYVYLASIPFALLAAAALREALLHAQRLRPVMPGASALPVALTVVAVGVLAFYGWQTVSQNRDFGDGTGEWEALVSGLERAYPELPPESTVYVRGGPLTVPLLQCAVLPALGEVLWGDVKLFTTLGDDPSRYRVRPGYGVFAVDASDGPFREIDLAEAGPGDTDVFLLPHVTPDATGNLCVQEGVLLPQSEAGPGNLWSR